MSSIVFRKVNNRIFEVFIFFFALILIIPLVLIIFMIIQKGISAINWEFLTSIRTPAYGSISGGILSNAVGTALLVALATFISVPIGVLTGTYLAENQKGITTFIIQQCIEILQGIPSIIFGLVSYIWIVQTTGKFSGISGSVALALMMLPVIVKSTEETVKMTPRILKEASIALGVPYYKTILRIVLPTAFSGIISGILLGIARIAGETAPLLFTAYGNNFFNVDMTKPIASLPHLIFNYATSPYPDSHTVAWGASFVLVSTILILNIITKLAVKKWKT